VGWKAFKEYVGGALWVMPSIAALIALAAGYGLSQIDVPPGSRLDWLAFQGTADDARALLISISSTVVTVIALVLGLTVVVLSGFLATFVYSAGGLFTVGLEAGTRTEVYPRFAVSVAILLLFVSLGMVIYFADHLATESETAASWICSSARHCCRGMAAVARSPAKIKIWMNCIKAISLHPECQRRGLPSLQVRDMLVEVQLVEQ
jgi:uncharacterized membrane protein